MGRKASSSQAGATSFSQLQIENEALKKEVAELHRKLERMSELLLNAQRTRFGQSSEKRSYVMQGGQQLRLFNEAEAEQDHKAPELTEETVAVSAHKRKPKRTVAELTANLPVEEILITLPESELVCDRCGGKLVMIGKKLESQRIQVIPRQCKLLKYYSCTYACRKCEEKTGFGNLITTVTPPFLLKHSLATASSVADVMIRKYVEGRPLARQEKIWAREGLELSRATMSNWVIQTAQGWLKPLYRSLKKQLLGCSVIHADETVVQVLKEDGKPAASESRMWVYASNDRSGKPIRYFEYQPSRSGKHAAVFLKGFNGCLVTDGYAGYNQVEGVVRCGCWAHMRRKWREAMPKGATKENSKAAIGYDYCNKLFAAEKKYAGLSDAERKTARQVGVESLLEAYWCWVETLDPVPGSKLAEAVAYARNQKPYLSAFLDYGEVDISNNFAENAIRPFTLGRKNWLFCDTPKGADSSAIVYTLVETAKANGLEPYAYLLQALTELPYLGKSPSQEDLNAFLPWSAKMQAACVARNTTTAGDLC